MSVVNFPVQSQRVFDILDENIRYVISRRGQAVLCGDSTQVNGRECAIRSGPLRKNAQGLDEISFAFIQFVPICSVIQDVSKQYTVDIFGSSPKRDEFGVVRAPTDLCYRIMAESQEIHQRSHGDACMPVFISFGEALKDIERFSKLSLTIYAQDPLVMWYNRENNVLACDVTVGTHVQDAGRNLVQRLQPLGKRIPAYSTRWR